MRYFVRLSGIGFAFRIITILLLASALCIGRRAFGVFPVLRAHERELREFARKNLAHFKAPHSVTFVKELPKTATGKIQKYILRAQRPAIAPQ